MTIETPPVDEAAATPPEPASVPEQHARDRRIWWTLAAVGLVVFVVVAIAGRPLVVRRLEAARGLDTASEQIAATVIVVNSADALVRAQVGTETASASAEASPSIAKAEEQLSTAVKLIEAGSSSLTEDEQRRAAIVKTLAQSRIEMLRQATVILGAGEQVAAAVPLADQAWKLTLASDAFADQAIAQSNRQTKAGRLGAAPLNTQAEQGFSAARELFSRAATAFPEANLERYVAYCDLRLNQTRLSKQADAAFLAGSATLASTLTASYNAADAQSIAAAALLPVPPAKAIADAYKAGIQASNKAYLKARTKAKEAEKAHAAL